MERQLRSQSTEIESAQSVMVKEAKKAPSKPVLGVKVKV